MRFLMGVIIVKNRTVKVTLIFAVLTLAIGLIVGMFSVDSVQYEALQKPWFAPPGFFFGIAWSILYLMTGAAAGRIYLKLDRPCSNIAFSLYMVQYFLNLMWTFIFFKSQLYDLAAIWIVVLLILATVVTILFFRLDVPAGILMLPYLLWLLYALLLSLEIAKLN